jgi:hypothetical protein
MKEASRKVAAGDVRDVPEAIKRTLKKYGVINAKSQFAGSMIEKAFWSIDEVGSPIGNTINGKSDLVDDGLQEWAEELAALGERRNLTERKLRGIVLNFLRMSALQGKTLDKLGDQVIKLLPEARRKQLLGLPLDSLFQKLMWLELVGVITGNWQLFEIVFGDRKLFEEHSGIVNDRPDAHAKEWDVADFALYRRSLQWMEDRLAKLQ